MINRAPTWFRLAAIVAILFELFGLSNFVADAMRTPEGIAKLPIDEQAMWRATPSWVYVAYGIATIAGAVGALALAARRKLSIPLLGLSLAAVIVQFGGIFLTPALRIVQPQGAWIAPADHHRDLRVDLLARASCPSPRLAEIGARRPKPPRHRESAPAMLLFRLGRRAGVRRGERIAARGGRPVAGGCRCTGRGRIG